jgi:hypothetical protein
MMGQEQELKSLCWQELIVLLIVTIKYSSWSKESNSNKGNNIIGSPHEHVKSFSKQQNVTASINVHDKVVI